MPGVYFPNFNDAANTGITNSNAQQEAQMRLRDMREQQRRYEESRITNQQTANENLADANAFGNDTGQLPPGLDPNTVPANVPPAAVPVTQARVPTTSITQQQTARPTPSGPLHFLPPDANATVHVTQQHIAQDPTLTTRINQQAQAGRVVVRRNNDGSYDITLPRNRRSPITETTSRAVTGLANAPPFKQIGDVISGPANAARLASDAMSSALYGVPQTPSDTVQAPVAPTRGVRTLAPSASIVAQPASTSGTPNPNARSTRNNNPGNIEFGAFARRMGATSSDGRFAIFPTPQAGAAAQDALLTSYGVQGINTVAGIVNKWAPGPTHGGDNTQAEVDAYIARVANHLGVDPNQPIDLGRREIRQAIAQAQTAVEAGTGGGTQVAQVAPTDTAISPAISQVWNDIQNHPTGTTPAMEEAQRNLTHNINLYRIAAKAGDNERADTLRGQVLQNVAAVDTGNSLLALRQFTLFHNLDPISRVLTDYNGVPTTLHQIDGDHWSLMIPGEKGQGRLVGSLMTLSDLQNNYLMAVNDHYAAARMDAETAIAQHAGIANIDLQAHLAEESAKGWVQMQVAQINNLGQQTRQQIHEAWTARTPRMLADGNGGIIRAYTDENGQPRADRLSTEQVQAADAATDQGGFLGMFRHRAPMISQFTAEPAITGGLQGVPLQAQNPSAVATPTYDPNAVNPLDQLVQ